MGHLMIIELKIFIQSRFDEVKEGLQQLTRKFDVARVDVVGVGPPPGGMVLHEGMEVAEGVEGRSLGNLRVQAALGDPPCARVEDCGLEEGRGLLKVIVGKISNVGAVEGRFTSGVGDAVEAQLCAVGHCGVRGGEVRDGRIVLNVIERLPYNVLSVAEGEKERG